MDMRAEKLAKARKKLRDHQEKKNVTSTKEEPIEFTSQNKVQSMETQNYSGNLKLEDSNTFEVDECFKDSEIQSESEQSTLNLKSDINLTTMLISNKTNLEMEVKKLNEKLAQEEYLHGLEVASHNNSKQRILKLEFELSNISDKYAIAIQTSLLKDENLREISAKVKSLTDENNNLLEQLEFTKSILTAKESENTQLHNNIFSYQKQLDIAQLQIQQLTDDSNVHLNKNRNDSEDVKDLLQKISNLGHEIEILQKERDQRNAHYEHFVQELNEQLQLEVNKNTDLAKEIQQLYNRENSLVDQISDMEIRLQNYNFNKDTENIIQNKDGNLELEKKYANIEMQLETTNNKFTELQKQHSECLAKIKELTEKTTSNQEHDSISITKLNADIASDKLAAQRATEQNRKLKMDIEELEQIIVKMTKDKLELTEKWTHEKQLNKELILKLAEIQENLKNMSSLLKAKDEEMIRLQNENRALERRQEKMLEDTGEINLEVTSEVITENNHTTDIVKYEEMQHNQIHPSVDTKKITCIDVLDDTSKNIKIQKEDAMLKLQERFLNIMDEVANLSDEKHRLEHIILQLQNETDTICEYIALYQQQRSLLKRREEERSSQLKIFQKECDQLKNHLEELRDLLLGFAEDKELTVFLKNETRLTDLNRVKDLLEKLQNCSLINPNYKTLDLNIFYPCSCCSGQLINI